MHTGAVRATENCFAPSEALLSSGTMTALLAVQGHESPTESRYAPSEASVSSVHEDPSLDDDAASRITSNSLASSSRGSHCSSACLAVTLNLCPATFHNSANSQAM